METLLKLQKKKYEEALETIAYLKQALYCFKDFDIEEPKDSWNKVCKIAFGCMDSANDEVFIDPNNFTPWKTFLKNWCKDTCQSFGTSMDAFRLNVYPYPSNTGDK